MLKRRWLKIAIAGVMLLLLLGSFIFWYSPRLLSLDPAAGSTQVPATTPLRLTFSRQVLIDSVKTHLHVSPAQTGDYEWDGESLVFTPDKPWPSRESVTIRLEAGVTSLSWPHLTSFQERQWTFTIRDPQLAFLFPINSPADIYLLNPANGEQKRLETSPGAVLDFTVNPRGTAIYYNTSHGNGGSSLHRYDLATGENTLLLDCPQALCRNLSISPADDYLAYERTSLVSSTQASYPQVWLLPLLPSEASKAAGEPLLIDQAGHQTQKPVWGNSGWLAYYCHKEAAFIFYNPYKNTSQILPSQTGIAGVWSSDGMTYIYPEIMIQPVGESTLPADLASIPSSHLLRYDLTEETIEDLTASDGFEDATPAFDPASNILAFGRKYLDVARWTPGRQLWLLNLENGEAHALTNDPYYNYYAITWSPDGSQMAYMRFNKNLLIEPPEIWIANGDGSQGRRVLTGGYSPQWIP